jgi:uncharacterized membrane protein
MVMVGMLIAIIGSIIYLTSDGYASSSAVLDGLWEGKDLEQIWESSTGTEAIGGHEVGGSWYLRELFKGDAIAASGIALSCLGAVLGMWASVFVMWRAKEKLYLVLGLIIAIILVMSAMGVVSIH